MSVSELTSKYIYSKGKKKTFLGTMDFISKVKIKRTQFSGTMDVAILHEEFVEGDALGHQVMIMTMMTMMMMMM